VDLLFREIENDLLNQHVKVYFYSSI